MANDTAPVPARTPGNDDAQEPRRTTSVYLPVSLLDALDEIAAEEDRSRTWLIERAVVEWLARRRGGLLT